MSLSALSEILTTSIQAFEAAHRGAGINVPTLDTPFEQIALDNDPAVIKARQTIVAAAHQIIQTVRPAPETMQLATASLYTTSALGLAEQYNIADALAEAGPQGLHVKQLSEKIGLNSQSIERILRFLATQHIFKEVSPNVFVNNRLSGILLKNKPLADILSNPSARYEKGVLAAGVSMTFDEAFRSASYLGKFLSDPGEYTTPFGMAHGTDKTLFKWYEEPGNELRLHRFASTMDSVGKYFPKNLIANGIKGAAPGSVIVDIGGSIGQATMSAYQILPDYKYIIQDLPELEEPAKAYWNAQAPQALTTGAIRIMPHSFFDPQPVKNAAVYFFRIVLHDWADSDVLKILKNVREAAGPQSKLVVFDSMQKHTCAAPGKSSTVPAPLLENLGIGGTGMFGPAMDFYMWALFNARERTEDDMRSLGVGSGWKLESVSQSVLATYTFSVI